MASPGMEVYTTPDQGLADVYLIQGTESNPQFIGQPEQFEAMYSEGTPSFVVDQGMYYPTAPNYGYVYTGFESTGEFEGQPTIFTLDGQDIQYTVSANENLPYVYYTPSYGYAQSPYNPYNPYIPGAIIGADGSYVTPQQQYYTLPSYENPVSAPAYMPMMVQSGPDIMANGITDPFVDHSVSANLNDGPAVKRNVPAISANSSQNVIGDASRRNAFAKVSDGGRAISGSIKQPVPGITSGNFSSQASSQIRRAIGPQGIENGSNGKLVASGVNQLNAPLSSFESSNHGQASLHKVKPKSLYGRVPENVKVNPEVLTEQNRGPRTNKSKNQLVVRAYTTRAGNPDAKGNITINTDQYNSRDFPVDYVNAKFFVIKSYSEDDVHKSIKYNMWSSTPNGNKKLNNAYEDAQRVAMSDSRGCPIFFFFSVNASGQFCGVAEMIGPVDFHKDMDFWQQDKWSGSFPVKWHIVKDLPNPNFRHIILENNENKSVTNSRDTQEIPYKKGLEMLKIYHNYPLKTSLLDDFTYYENRQRILHEERARNLIKSYENPYMVPLVDPPRKFHSFHDFPSVENAKQDVKNLATLSKSNGSSDGQSNFYDKKVNGQDSADGVQNNVDELKIGTLSINDPKDTLSTINYPKDPKIQPVSIGTLSTKNPKEPEANSSLPATTASTRANIPNIVTIGSMPVKVNGTELSGFLTIGKIPLNPRDLQRD